MTLKQLRWIAFLAPIAFLLVLEVLRFSILERFLPVASGHGIAAVAMFIGIILFSTAIFHVIENLHTRVLRQNRELSNLHYKERTHAAQLRALNEAGVGITSELSLETVLQKVVDPSPGARAGPSSGGRHSGRL